MIMIRIRCLKALYTLNMIAICFNEELCFYFYLHIYYTNYLKIQFSEFLCILSVEKKPYSLVCVLIYRIITVSKKKVPTPTWYFFLSCKNTNLDLNF